MKFHLKGVRIQPSLNTTHERVAQARKSQIEYRLATGTLIMPSETPIGDFLEGFCQYLRGTRTRKFSKNDISYLRIFFGPVCPSVKPGNTCNRSKVLRKERPKVNKAKERKEDPNLVLIRSVLERFLYRLGCSQHKDRFILKGAMLFAAWTGQPHRPTRNLDLSAMGDSSDEALIRAFGEMVRTEVKPDALEFDDHGISVSDTNGEETTRSRV